MMFEFPVKMCVFAAVTGGGVGGGIFETCDASSQPFLNRRLSGKKMKWTAKGMMKDHAKTIGIATTLMASGIGHASAAASAEDLAATHAGPGVASMNLVSDLAERIADLRAVGGVGGGATALSACYDPAGCLQSEPNNCVWDGVPPWGMMACDGRYCNEDSKAHYKKNESGKCQCCLKSDPNNCGLGNSVSRGGCRFYYPSFF